MATQQKQNLPNLKAKHRKRDSKFYLSIIDCKRNFWREAQGVGFYKFYLLKR